MSADYLGKIKSPVHFKGHWKRAMAAVHQDWESLTLAELDPKSFPPSRVLVMTRAE